ncbi:hypothetical protein PT2222_40138 [Paraburkholderia tropica]
MGISLSTPPARLLYRFVISLCGAALARANAKGAQVAADFLRNIPARATDVHASPRPNAAFG